MPHYLMQIGYNTEAWQALVKKPQNRADIVGAIAEKLGGKLTGAWFAFGDYDIVAIFEFPANVDAAAIAIAFAAGGAVRSVKTTALMSMEEGIQALKKAAGSGYRAVTAKT